MQDDVHNNVRWYYTLALRSLVQHHGQSTNMCRARSLWQCTPCASVRSRAQRRAIAHALRTAAHVMAVGDDIIMMAA